MSIDPLNNREYLRVLEQQDRRLHSPQAENRFSQQLEKVGKEELAYQQAQDIIELARLKLWEGLFSSEESSTDDFLSFSKLSVLQAPPVSQHQVEKVYAQLQPTLRDESSDNRTDIEKMIDQVAEKVSLAPELIRSVVAAESDFQPNAVSPAGAQGLMQLMPATAKELGVEDSFDPGQNLLGGSVYLKQLLEKYDGDLDKALAAYNWGPGNVDRKGLARMPEETRNYLSKVKSMLKKSV